MPKRIDEPDDDRTGMDHGDRTGAAADAGRAADDRDLRDLSDDPNSFDPSSRGDEAGETM
jgi:hypothetical protein